jgi:hypothetical protein
MHRLQVRDVALSIGFQSVATRTEAVPGTGGQQLREVRTYPPWVLERNLPALRAHYGDAFPAIHAFGDGPSAPSLNLAPCNSDRPGGTSGHVTQRCVAMGLRASFGHLFMIWMADDALLNYFNFYSRDLRRVWARMPWASGYADLR